MVNIKVSSCNPYSYMPSLQSAGAAGVDLHSCEQLTIEPNRIGVIGTGLKMELPIGYEAQIRSRSGLAASHGLFVLNSPGTIDSDYRGEIKVILMNISDRPFDIKIGDRIAQMVINKIEMPRFILTSEEALSKTVRGANGFGSTGQ